MIYHTQSDTMNQVRKEKRPLRGVRLSEREAEFAFFAMKLYYSMRLSENADSLRRKDKKKRHSLAFSTYWNFDLAISPQTI